MKFNFGLLSHTTCKLGCERDLRPWQHSHIKPILMLPYHVL